MRGWLKLVGTIDRQLPELWAIERKDLLREVRFSEVNPPDPISMGDRLVLHATGHQRLVAIVEITAEEPRRDPHPAEWEKQWPLILDVRVLVKVGRMSAAPATALLGELYDLRHAGFVPLTGAQLAKAEQLLHKAA